MTCDKMNEEAIWVVCSAAFGALAALMAATLPVPLTLDLLGQVVTTAPQVLIGVIDDERLRLICVAGSLGGAILSVGVFRPKGVQELVWKLTCSAVSGILFSPMFMQWADIETRTDQVLATSGFVALMSWSVMTMAVPLLTRLTESWIKTKGKPED